MPSCLENGIPTLRCIPFLFKNIIDAAFFFAGAAAIYFIVLGGIRFITSGGNQVKVEGAKKTVTFAILGLLVIVFSFFLIKVFSTTTGVGCSVLGVGC